MTTELAVKDRSFGPLLGRARRFVFGPPLPARLPERVQTTIRQEQDQTEILVSLLQLLAVASFAALYTLTPKAFDPQMVPFEPVPVTLAVYTGFTLVRLWLAWQRRLQAWFLALSVVVDISVLMVTIWTFHLQYQEPPPLYLKAPTMLYAFILIALRTLRFEPWLVLLAGITAAAGWLVLVAYAVLGAGGAGITHDFAVYAMSYQVLLGAEVDKVVSLLMVTLILTLGLVRARKLLFRAVTDQVAATELSRFFAPEVAGRIRDSDMALEPGQAELRTAAIVMVDMRGFTPLSPEARAPRRHGAALGVSGAGGRRDDRARRQHRQVHGRRRFWRASARPGRAPALPPTRCAPSMPCWRAPRLGPRSGPRVVCPAPWSGRRSRPGPSCAVRSGMRAGSSTP